MEPHSFAVGNRAQIADRVGGAVAQSRPLAFRCQVFPLLGLTVSG